MKKLWIILIGIALLLLDATFYFQSEISHDRYSKLNNSVIEVNQAYVHYFSALLDLREKKYPNYDKIQQKMSTLLASCSNLGNQLIEYRQHHKGNASETIKIKQKIMTDACLNEKQKMYRIMEASSVIRNSQAYLLLQVKSKTTIIDHATENMVLDYAVSPSSIDKEKVLSALLSPTLPTPLTHNIATHIDVISKHQLILKNSMSNYLFKPSLNELEDLHQLLISTYKDEQGTAHKYTIGSHTISLILIITIFIFIWRLNKNLSTLKNTKTNLKLAYRELQVSESLLRRSQKMDAIGQLTGGIAHDFNNILGIILGNLDLLKLQIKDKDKSEKRIKAITNAAQRAADLTRQLLTFSRKQSEQAVVTNINQLIVNMENLASRSVTPQVTIVHQLAQGLWNTKIEPGDFTDTLLNLILNSHDAMTDGGQITIETRNTTLDKTYCDNHNDVTPGFYIEMILSDNGTGMTPEQLEHIFEPFYTTKDVGKGTGLGLSMVYGFIQRSNGHIKVESELGQGCTTHMYLPMSENHSNTETSPEPNVPDEPNELGTGFDTILLVDDELDLLELNKELLQLLGYSVLTADNGKQALKILTERKDIRLLISDIIMPGGMNGYELADAANTNQPDLKVLLVSGYTDKDTPNNKSIYKENILQKPFSQKQLSQKVLSLLKE